MNTNREEKLKSAGEALLSLLDVMKHLHEERVLPAGTRTDSVIPQLQEMIPVGSTWRSLNNSDVYVVVIAHAWSVDTIPAYKPSVIYRHDTSSCFKSSHLMVVDSENWFKRFERGAKNV